MSRRLVLLILLVAASRLPSANRAEAMCIPVYCVDCELQSMGQLNIVVMDRAAGTIQLIPNIRVAGNAAEWGLIVPTPSIPDLEPAYGEIWTQMFALTAPAPSDRAPGGLGCGGHTSVYAQPAGGGDDGVDIIGRLAVGAFDATILSAGDPSALGAWLNSNGFSLSPEDELKFAPYVARGWIFTAMKLDTARVEPGDQVDVNVDPVRFTYAADTLEVPLPILSIHRAERLPMAFFVVDGHRATIPGFTTVYANAVNRSEASAVAARYPELGALIAPGRFVTRLDRIFGPDDPMDGSVYLTRAATDDQYRRTSSFWSGLDAWPVALLMIGLGVTGVARLARRRRLSAGPSASPHRTPPPRSRTPRDGRPAA